MARTASVWVLVAALAATPVLASAQAQAPGEAPIVAYVARGERLNFGVSAPVDAFMPAPTGGLGGVIGAAIGVAIAKKINDGAATKKFLAEHRLERLLERSPADRMAADLAAVLADRQGGVLAQAPITLAASQKAPSRANFEGATYVVDVDQAVARWGLDGGGLSFDSALKLYDARSRKVVQTLKCNLTARDVPMSIARVQKEATAQAVIDSVVEAVDICTDRLAGNLTTPLPAKSGPRSRTVASAAPTPRPARAAPAPVAVAPRSPPVVSLPAVALPPVAPRVVDPPVAPGQVAFANLTVIRAPTLGQRNDIVRRLAPLPPGGVVAQMRCALLLDDGVWRPDCGVVSPQGLSPALADAFHQLALAYRLQPPPGVNGAGRYETVLNLALYPQDRLTLPPHTGPLLATRAVTLATVPTSGDLARNYPAWGVRTSTTMRVDATCAVMADLSLACSEAKAARVLDDRDAIHLREFEEAGLAAAASISVAPRRFDGGSAVGSWIIVPVAFDAR